MSLASRGTSSARRWRPTLHFTPVSGWINDPYGVTWDGSEYHMFFQQLPDHRTWRPQCRWGHAQSPDLVHWQELPPALTPQSFEIGCWSGSATVGDDGVPSLLYTRMTENDTGIGQIALARGDATWSEWTTTPDELLVERPPPDLPVLAFRDPYVFRWDGQYRLIVGAGLAGPTAAALQYTSPDLFRWTFDAVLSSRPDRREDETWTGSVWECPQLIEVDGTWVLLVSVWERHTLHYVAAATGDYDGRAFTARAWQRLTHGDIAYAMSAFRDRDGRPCVVSWLREEPSVPAAAGAWTGAHSLVSVLRSIPGGRVALTPHPNIDDLPWTDLPAAGHPEATQRVPPCPVEITLDPRASATVTVRHGAHHVLTLVADTHERCVRLTRPGLDDHQISTAGGAVRVILDADIVEVFGPRQYGAYRLTPHDRPEQVTITSTGHLRLRAVADDGASPPVT